MLFLSGISFSQTYFAISQINIEPEYPTTEDSISIHLIGYLTETGVIIDNVEVLVQDNEVFLTINVHSSGGFQMLIDHTETINLGLLSSGDYHINISGDYISDNVSDPSQYHFTVEEATGINNSVCQNDFSVYPNPASEYISLSCHNCKDFSFNIINSNGVKLLSSKKVRSIDISQFTPGLYYLLLFNDEGKFVKSFIKK